MTMPVDHSSVDRKTYVSISTTQTDYPILYNMDATVRGHDYYTLNIHDGVPPLTIWDHESVYESAEKKLSSTSESQDQTTLGASANSLGVGSVQGEQTSTVCNKEMSAEEAEKLRRHGMK